MGALAGGALGSSAGASLLGSTALGGAMTGPIAGGLNTLLSGMGFIPGITTQGVGGLMGGLLGGAGAGAGMSALTGGSPGMGALTGGAMGALGPMIAQSGVPPAIKNITGAANLFGSMAPTTGPVASAPPPPPPPPAQPRPAPRMAQVPPPSRISAAGMRASPAAMSMYNAWLPRAA